MPVCLYKLYMSSVLITQQQEETDVYVRHNKYSYLLQDYMTEKC